MRLIATSGLPGSTGTYQPNDLFDIDWDSFEDDDVIVIVHHVAIDDAPRLSAREAAALMAGLQYLSASPENAGSASLASLLAKLDRRRVVGAQPRIGVAETEADESLGLIREAVAEGRQLEFDYRNARGERGRRRADPLRIISQDADWYLQAYCHTREDVRNFRVDRMSELVRHRRADRRPLATASCPTPCSRVPIPISTSSSTSRPGRCRCCPTTSPTRPRREVDGRMRVTLRLAHVHGLKRLVAGLPGLVTVVAPAEARAAVAEWAAAGLAGYSERGRRSRRARDDPRRLIVRPPFAVGKTVG